MTTSLPVLCYCEDVDDLHTWLPVAKPPGKRRQVSSPSFRPWTWWPFPQQSALSAGDTLPGQKNSCDPHTFQKCGHQCTDDLSAIYTLWSETKTRTVSRPWPAGSLTYCHHVLVGCKRTWTLENFLWTPKKCLSQKVDGVERETDHYTVVMDTWERSIFTPILIDFHVNTWLLLSQILLFHHLYICHILRALNSNDKAPNSFLICQMFQPSVHMVHVTTLLRITMSVELTRASPGCSGLKYRHPHWRDSIVVIDNKGVGGDKR